MNVVAGRPEDRRLLTGMHVVADIACSACGAELGWKYVSSRLGEIWERGGRGQGEGAGVRGRERGGGRKGGSERVYSLRLMHGRSRMTIDPRIFTTPGGGGVATHRRRLTLRFSALPCSGGRGLVTGIQKAVCSSLLLL